MSPPPIRRPNNFRDSRPPHFNAIDHVISQHHGSTFALDFSTAKIQSSKGEIFPDVQVRLEELTREIGYLRQEVKFYRECFVILQELRETAYDVYQQLFLASYFPPDAGRLHQLTTQLHHGLERTMRQEIAAGNDWKSFWGVELENPNSIAELV